MNYKLKRVGAMQWPKPCLIQRNLLEDFSRENPHSTVTCARKRKGWKQNATVESGKKFKHILKEADWMPYWIQCALFCLSVFKWGWNSKDATKIDLLLSIFSSQSILNTANIHSILNAAQCIFWLWNTAWTQGIWIIVKHINIHIYMYTHIHMHIHMCIHMCVYIHIQSLITVMSVKGKGFRKRSD